MNLWLDVFTCMIRQVFIFSTSVSVVAVFICKSNATQQLFFVCKLYPAWRIIRDSILNAIECLLASHVKNTTQIRFVRLQTYTESTSTARTWTMLTFINNGSLLLKVDM